MFQGQLVLVVAVVVLLLLTSKQTLVVIIVKGLYLLATTPELFELLHSLVESKMTLSLITTRVLRYPIGIAVFHDHHDVHVEHLCELDGFPEEVSPSLLLEVETLLLVVASYKMCHYILLVVGN